MLPKEGATGWSDTWMISSKAKHPNCMYKWMNYITSPDGPRPGRASTSVRPRPTRRRAPDAAAGLLRQSTTPPTPPSPSSSTTGRRRTKYCVDGSGKTTAPTTRSGPTRGTTCGRRDLTVAPRPTRRGATDPSNGRRVASPDLSTAIRASARGAARRADAVAASSPTSVRWPSLLLAVALHDQRLHRASWSQTISLTNFRELHSDPTFRTVTLRTIGIALSVTVIDLVLALPIAFYMAKVASRRTRRALAGGRRC